MRTPDPADLPAGLHEGARVALLVPGSNAYVDLVMALTAAGVHPVPLDPALSEVERSRVLAAVAPDMVVEEESAALALLAGLPHHLRRALPRCRPMHCTSGTTGTPKGVQSPILTAQEGEALVAEERDLWGFHDGDVHLVLSPLHHSAPLRFASGTLLAGGRFVVPGRFDPARVSAAIEAERPTSMFCVPAHLQRLFAHWDEVGVPDLSSFRLVAHAGAPCPAPVKRRLVELFPDGSTWEFYGSTEGQFTACRSEEWLLRPGTVGRARPGRVISADEDGHLWCVVPPHARFVYAGDPEKTAAAWRQTPAGPAFTVGDVGRVDEDGYVHLEGRRSDLIITGGVNVYPLEVENTIREHPGVEDVAVYAVPDDHWGQRVCAAVVGEATAAELDVFARGRLVPAKRPKEYHRVDDLPRTPTGKVRRDLLGPV